VPFVIDSSIIIATQDAVLREAALATGVGVFVV